jgi:hypothetical protein
MVLYNNMNDFKIVCDSEDQLKSLKEKAMKCKIIALDKMEKHPLLNPSYFTKREKTKVIEIMNEWFSKADEEIDKWFNDIVNERILGNGLDYNAYPIYDLSKGANGPSGPIMDTKGNLVEVENK